VTGLLLFWIVPALSRAGLENMGELLVSAGVGFLSLVGVPVAVLILAITLIGLPIALISIAGWMVAAYLAKIVVAGFLGRSLLARSGDTQPAPAVGLLAGLLVVFVAINLPFVGGLINFLLVMLGMGIIALRIFQMPRWHAAQAA